MLRALWRDKRKGQKGFTLVELMVVIAIIGILAAIAVPSYNKYQESAKIKAAMAEGHNIATAAQMYYIDHDQTWTKDLDEIKKYVEVKARVNKDGWDEIEDGTNYGFGWYLDEGDTPKVKVVDGVVEEVKSSQ